jgi:hypothetical protein
MVTASPRKRIEQRLVHRQDAVLNHASAIATWRHQRVDVSAIHR